jgi:hypothetical protein
MNVQIFLVFVSNVSETHMWLMEVGVAAYDIANKNDIMSKMMFSHLFKETKSKNEIADTTTF